MVTVMRRKLAMIAVLGGLAAGLGCQHIGGKSDCGYNPADYAIGPPTQPYPTYPVIGNPAPVKDKTDTTLPPIPKTKTGSDVDPTKKFKDGGNQ
jgi:hypothetical protein